MDIEDDIITFDSNTAAEYFKVVDGFSNTVGEFIKFYINMKINSEYFKNIEYVNISSLNKNYEGLKVVERIGKLNI